MSAFTGDLLLDDGFKLPDTAAFEQAITTDTKVFSLPTQ